ncbi:hypothetical protein [Streptomyces sp. NPDC060243]|uniref:hypothetical protein n=1 Tax=Streptomyces sp. NPDC060243 TaxID=3347081 RepID=UPI00365B80C1
MTSPDPTPSDSGIIEDLPTPPPDAGDENDPPEASAPETPPPPTDAETIHWEPATWYSATFACLTPGCPEENIVKSVGMLYSNNGQAKYVRIVDSVCGKDCKILTATKLIPQPPEE